MLIELYAKNYGSFRDGFHISFLPADIEPGSTEGLVPVDVDGEDEPLWLLRCIGIYGPNASGKSTVIRVAGGLSYLLARSATLSSDQPLHPYEPFLLSDSARGSPVEFGVRAVVNKVVYQYEIKFNQAEFVEERLVECGKEKDVILFERRGTSVVGTWTLAPRFSLLKESFRPNALLLSLADRFAPDLALGVATSLARLLTSADPRTWTRPWWRSDLRPFIANRIASDEKFASWLVSLLKHADTGIVSHKVEELAMDSNAEPDESGVSGSSRSREYKISFLHQGDGGSYQISYGRESAGTQKTVDLAWYLYALSHGDEPRAFFIDEIGSSLHPVLISSLLREFNRSIPHTDVRGQLVFATHETSLIDGEARSAVLRRDQVYFVEKDLSGSSRMTALAEFRERANLNIRKRYLQGRYGAIPSVDNMLGD